MPEGLWVKCPGCAQVIYNKDLAANLQRLPEVRASLPASAPPSGCGCCSTASGPSTTPDLRLDRPAEVHRHQAVSRRGSRPSIAGDRPEGRGDRRDRARIDGIDGRRRRDGVRLHRRQHGRRRRREDHARASSARIDERLPVIIVSLLGRRADDGRRAVADADGEDLRRRSRGSIARGCRTSRCSPIRRPAA